MRAEGDGVRAVANGAKETQRVKVGVVDSATHELAGGRQGGDPESFFARASTLGECAQSDGSNQRVIGRDVFVVIDHVCDADAGFT